jgi:serine/threonine protein phosphatase PrpC
MVVDGLGGQAAGGKAADTALAMLRVRLERRTGPVADRIREAITTANNEILRQAATRAEWQGMACVLTVAVVENGRAVIGHVGDTRLYKLRPDGIEKITRDHSPVGEREDAGEIPEAEAMRHPRRNEVYRDVGSERHNAYDPDFIDIYEIPFEADAALLLCSDGLTDMVSLAAIGQIVGRTAGDARQVVHALVDAANAAGGKDNVSCVYVEREQFARQVRGPEPGRARPFRNLLAGMVLMALAATVVMMRASPIRPLLVTEGPRPPLAQSDGVVVVRPGGSIAAAIAGAAAGTDVIVEPGEYRERLVLRDGVRVVSRIPRAATLRLPSAASEGEAAVVALGSMTAELSGFRIVGDAATPLGTGIVVRDAAVSIVNCEISGAARTAIDLSGRYAVVIGNDIHDNPGTAIAIRSGAAPRVTHNVFSRNGLASQAASSVIIERGANPVVSGNIFEGTAPLTAMDEAVRGPLLRNNWFVASRRAEPSSPTNGRDR